MIDPAPDLAYGDLALQHERLCWAGRDGPRQAQDPDEGEGDGQQLAAASQSVHFHLRPAGCRRATLMPPYRLAFLDVHLVKPRTQTTSELLRVVMGPEVHEEE